MKKSMHDDHEREDLMRIDVRIVLWVVIAGAVVGVMIWWATS